MKKILAIKLFALVALFTSSLHAQTTNAPPECFNGKTCLKQVYIDTISIPVNGQPSFSLVDNAKSCYWHVITFDVSNENGKAIKDTLLMAKAASLPLNVTYEPGEIFCKLFAIQL